ncbi:hypothetical protein F0562_010685 [Nyssa sinensis]|uniref:Peptidase C1A papain C-terminal domain-containing protein n=1 Tax=Nyssa sinensis TaxID=561372 RepID=A0A5J5A3A6_9ASTE|nr:hypothetical protein F0562_010685 [Nyssa sinensis]
MISIIQCKCISLALLFILGALASHASSPSLHEASMYERHQQWMARYGHVYKDADEMEKCFTIFKENVEHIESFNKAMNKPYKQGVNEFADRCCWAFSAVAAMEGITQLTTGKLISLAEQELVDCDTSGEDQGCEGGLMDTAFQYIQQNHGLTTEANYPYKGVDGTCNTKKAANHATPR